MTEPGPTPQRPYRAARAGRGLLAALVGLLLVLAAVVVGAAPAAAQNRVGASTPAMINIVGPLAGISAGQRLGRTSPQPQIGVATAVAAEGAGAGSRPFVMGIKDHLDDFAQAHGGTTWKSLPESQLPGDAWKSGVTRMLSNPNQRVLFNLDGVDVWGGLNRPGIDGGSEPTRGWGHACTEEVSAGAA